MDAAGQRSKKRHGRRRKPGRSDGEQAVQNKKRKRSEKIDEVEGVEEIDGGEVGSGTENGEQSKGSKEPSKRQLKREKAEQRVVDQKAASRVEAMQKGLAYISKWKHAKNEWKFEKLRQIWLMEHLLDDSLVPDSHFPTVIEYFEGCKGMARQQLVKKMMEVIKKVEDQQETEEDEEPKAMTEYRRAREVLQALPTET